VKHSAYIFDLDGTLMDSEVLWVRAVRELALEHDEGFTHEESLRIVYGRAWRDIYPDLVRRLPGLKLTIEEMQAALQRRFDRLRSEVEIRIEGSIRLLKRLAARDPVCIVSGSARNDVASAVEFLGLADHVRFFLASEDYAPGKPSPAGFLMAAERLAVPPTQCVVFEDSWAGVQAAKAAGMYCVALARAGAPAQDVSAADVVLDDLEKYGDIEIKAGNAAFCRVSMS